MSARVLTTVGLLTVITLMVVAVNLLYVQQVSGDNPIPPLHIDSSLPPMADLSVVADHSSTSYPRWRINVANNTVGRHPGVTVDIVKIRVTTYDRISAVAPAMAGRVKSTEVWTVRNILPNSVVQKIYEVPTTQAGDSDGLLPYGIYAEIIETDPVEPYGFQYNNDTEHWAMGDGVSGGIDFTNGNAVVLAGISDSFPRPGETTTFTVIASNHPPSRYPNTAGGDYNNSLLNVDIKISLSPGLTLGNAQQAPQGTSFNASTGIWSIDQLESTTASNRPLSFPLGVNLTTGDIPLEERCLTAELVGAVPWFAFHQHKREDDTTTVCLGEEPPIVVNSGEVALFYPYDCVGVTNRPCADEDTVEMVVRARRSEFELPTFVRIDGTPIGSRGETFLQPKTVVVQIRDPEGRYKDSISHSVTAGSVTSWHTGRKVSGSRLVEGVDIGYTRTGFDTKIADWTNVVRTVTVSGLNGGEPPGDMKVRWNSSRASTLFDPNPSHTRSPTTLGSRRTTVD